MSRGYRREGGEWLGACLSMSTLLDEMRDGEELPIMAARNEAMERASDNRLCRETRLLSSWDGGLREFGLYWGHESHEWPGWQLQMLHACNAAMQDPACLHRAQGTRGEKSQSQNVQALLFRASGFRACLQVTQPGRLSPYNCYTLRCLLTALNRPHDHSADRRLRNQYG